MKARKKLYSPVRYIVIKITLRIRSILILTYKLRVEMSDFMYT